MINKRWITLPLVYSRPFASKAVFWAILNEFEFAVEYGTVNGELKFIQNSNKMPVYALYNKLFKPPGNCLGAPPFWVLQDQVLCRVLPKLTSTELLKLLDLHQSKFKNTWKNSQNIEKRVPEGQFGNTSAAIWTSFPCAMFLWTVL